MANKVIAFLCLRIRLDEVTENELDSIDSPELLCLPWPENSIPQIGSTVNSGKLPGVYSDSVVEGCQYRLLGSGKIMIEICVRPCEDSDYEFVDMVLLHYFAEAGFWFDMNKKPIKEVLIEKGLYKEGLNKPKLD